MNRKTISIKRLLFSASAGLLATLIVGVLFQAISPAQAKLLQEGRWLMVARCSTLG